MTDRSVYQRMSDELMMWDNRMARACLRLGLFGYPTIYQLVSDEQMVQLIPSVMMPSDYSHWSKGKQAEREQKNAKFMHIFEAVLNTNPSLCYLGVTNTREMQLNVMAHATRGGHNVFFKMNKLFAETQPESIAARFAQGKRIIDDLVENPDWGWEGVEYVLDAAHALDNFVGWLPTVEGKVSDQQLRDELMKEARELRSQIFDASETSNLNKVQLENRLKLIEGQLLSYPIMPSNDILGTLIDTEYNPALAPEARDILSIVRERGRYFQPQARTKFMNEGWASFWEKAVLMQPEVGIPFEEMFGLIQAWTMHDRQILNMYLDPYALGLKVWEYIDRTYGYDEEAKIEIKSPRLKKDEDGYYTESPRAKNTVVHTVRNYDKMKEVVTHYDDNRFLNEFLSTELFEEMNIAGLDWFELIFKRINNILLQGGWGRGEQQLIFEHIPMTLEGRIQVVQIWMQAAKTANQYAAWAGTPAFPIPDETLQNMAQLLQIVGSYDQNKHAMRKQLVLRTGYNSLPNIKVVDTGRLSGGAWTLKHDLDPNFGPLLQSEARDTLKFFRRLCNAPARLLTWEIRVDWQGRPTGDPVPFEYYTEDGLTVKERFL